MLFLHGKMGYIIERWSTTNNLTPFRQAILKTIFEIISPNNQIQVLHANQLTKNMYSKLDHALFKIPMLKKTSMYERLWSNIPRALDWRDAYYIAVICYDWVLNYFHQRDPTIIKLTFNQRTYLLTIPLHYNAADSEALVFTHTLQSIVDNPLGLSRNPLQAFFIPDYPFFDKILAAGIAFEEFQKACLYRQFYRHKCFNPFDVIQEIIAQHRQYLEDQLASVKNAFNNPVINSIQLTDIISVFRNDNRWNHGFEIKFKCSLTVCPYLTSGNCPKILVWRIMLSNIMQILQSILGRHPLGVTNLHIDIREDEFKRIRGPNGYCRIIIEI
jgi:hypothetical protein